MPLLSPAEIVAQRPLKHNILSIRCWCRPRILQLCPEACCLDHPCDKDCWRCGGAIYVEPFDDHEETFIVHNDL